MRVHLARGPAGDPADNVVQRALAPQDTEDDLVQQRRIARIFDARLSLFEKDRGESTGALDPEEDPESDGTYRGRVSRFRRSAQDGLLRRVGAR